MIKFFRRIRHDLITTGKTGKYLKYAIGEILLVMIGILLALQVNNWNSDKRNEAKLKSFLTNLKKDIESDMQFIRNRDTLFAIFESDSEKAINKFHKAKSVNDILFIDSLFSSQWNDLRINKSVYQEMLSTGSIYTLKNKVLKDKLTNYYSFIESHQYYIKEVNTISTQLRNNEHLLPLHLITSKRNTQGKLNVKWITDPNSKTYLALYKFYTYTQNNSNTYRRTIFERVLNRSQDLVNEIDDELSNNN